MYTQAHTEKKNHANNRRPQSKRNDIGSFFEIRLQKFVLYELFFLYTTIFMYIVILGKNLEKFTNSLRFLKLFFFFY